MLKWVHVSRVSQLLYNSSGPRWQIRADSLFAMLTWNLRSCFFLCFGLQQTRLQEDCSSHTVGQTMRSKRSHTRKPWVVETFAQEPICDACLEPWHITQTTQLIFSVPQTRSWINWSGSFCTKTLIHLILRAWQQSTTCAHALQA